MIKCLHLTFLQSTDTFTLSVINTELTLYNMCNYKFKLHVYDLTFIVGGGGW